MKKKIYIQINELTSAIALRMFGKTIDDSVDGLFQHGPGVGQGRLAVGARIGRGLGRRTLRRRVELVLQIGDDNIRTPVRRGFACAIILVSRRAIIVVYVCRNFRFIDIARIAGDDDRLAVLNRIFRAAGRHRRRRH